MKRLSMYTNATTWAVRKRPRLVPAPFAIDDGSHGQPAVREANYYKISSEVYEITGMGGLVKYKRF